MFVYRNNENIEFVCMLRYICKKNSILVYHNSCFDMIEEPDKMKKYSISDKHSTF